MVTAALKRERMFPYCGADRLKHANCSKVIYLRDNQDLFFDIQLNFASETFKEPKRKTDNLEAMSSFSVVVTCQEELLHSYPDK